MKDEVILVCKSGKRSFSIEEAERRLRYKKVNPSQTWELAQPGYEFDGENIRKVSKPKAETKAPAEGDKPEG